MVDAGGGTVDITVHEVLADDKVKEIAAPSGCVALLSLLLLHLVQCFGRAQLCAA